MATKKKEIKEKDEITGDPPVYAGEVFDLTNKLIGKYVYLEGDQPGHQDLLDQFCNCWLDTYHHDQNFFLTLDLETTGLNYSSPDEHILLYSVSWDGYNAVVFPGWDFDFTLLKEVLSTIPLNNHNLKFDLRWLISKLEVEPIVYFDTLSGVQMAFAGLAKTNSFPSGFDNKPFALDNVVSNLIPGFKVSKAVRSQFIGMQPPVKFFRHHIEYAASDSLLTHRVTYTIKKRLFNTKSLDIYENIEKPLTQIMLTTEINGIPVDTKKVETIYTSKKDELTKLLEDIQTEVSNLPGAEKLSFGKKGDKFNPGAPAQIVKVLKLLGADVPNTSKDTLEVVNSTLGQPLVKKIMDYRLLRDQVSKQVKPFLETHIRYDTDTIHPDFQVYGAETGRLSCRDPNLMAVAKWMRSVVTARPGKKILQLDYSQFEFRACAAATNEPYLMDAYKERAELLPEMKSILPSYGYIDPDALVKDFGKGKVKLLNPSHEDLIRTFERTDIHRRNAALVSNKRLEDLEPKDREIGKCVALDTYVHTESGIIQVRDLLPPKLKAGTFYPLKNIRVLTDTGFEDCPQVYYNGKSKALKITTKMGRSVVCAPIHQFRSIDKKGKYAWIKAEKLKVGDDLFVAFTKSLDSKKSKTNKIAYYTMLGYLLNGADISGSKVTAKFQPNIVMDLYNETIDQDLWEKSLRRVKLSGVGNNQVNINNPDLANLLTDPLNNILKPLVKNPCYIDIASLLKGLCTWHFNYGLCIRNKDVKVLILLQNLTQRINLNGYVNTNTADGIPTLMFWGVDENRLKAVTDGKVFKEEYSLKIKKCSAPSYIHEKIYDAELQGLDPNTYLNKNEAELLEFLYSNNLRKDPIISIQVVDDIEMADLSVPANNTLVYNGLVSHNTLGYTLLYGGAAPRVRQALAKEGYYYSLEQCQQFIEIFFDKLPGIKKFIQATHRAVLKPGYIETVMGRRRFFDLGYKWRRDYESKMQDAFREATNYVFQGANADASKKAIVLTYPYQEQYEPNLRPLFLLPVHDELVYEVDDSIVDEFGEIVENIMVQTGSEAVGFKAPIEVSKQINQYWVK